MTLTVEPNFDELADFYRCSPRTTRRWHALGIDLHDPIAVAEALAAMKNPSRDSMSRLLEELNSPDFL
jgi:hypothetical protein